MASNYILTRCDGAFGCRCPEILQKVVEKKKRRNAYMRKYLAKRRAEKRNG